MSRTFRQRLYEAEDREGGKSWKIWRCRCGREILSTERPRPQKVKADHICLFIDVEDIT